jgi:RNA polymerase sigma-70 factor, ECF subfamily
LGLPTIGTTEFEKLFKICFEKYFECLYFYAHTYLKDREKAKDIVQGVFAKWWETKKIPGDAEACKAYLYVAVYRRSLNALRDENLMKVHSNQYVNHLGPNSTSSVETEFYEEMQTRIDAAIESLPTQSRTVFKKSRYDEKTYAEIAAEMDLSVRTVEVHISRALKALRERLHDYLQ